MRAGLGMKTEKVSPSRVMRSTSPWAPGGRGHRRKASARDHVVELSFLVCNGLVDMIKILKPRYVPWDRSHVRSNLDDSLVEFGLTAARHEDECAPATKR